MDPFDQTSRLLAECRELQQSLRRFRTLRALLAAPEGPGLRARLARVLGHVRLHVPTAGGPRPGAPGPVASLPPGDPATAAAPDSPKPVRAVHWNIEKALRRAGIERALREEPGLADADLVLLNEVDVGMARSGNLDVAASLGAALGRFAAWAPMFLEITAGRDDDVAAAGGRGNAEGLLGLAVLSRWPLGAVRVVELPSPSEFQFEVERMFGRHVALVAEVLRPGAPFVAVAAHLEVHRGRAHRAAQVRAAAEALRGETRPVILGGDFNTHTFDRGVPLASLRAGLPLLLAPEAALERRFVRPFEGRTREFLFDELRDAGFAWEPFTDFAPTLRLRFERVREARGLSTLLGPFRNAVLARMERRALLKLDWFAGRGWSGGRGWTVVGLDGPEGLSDHAPVGAEFR